jgi:hypothetical protein
LQIKKQHVLTQSNGFAEIEQAISLYLDMHDAGLNLTRLQDSEELKAFYQQDVQVEFNNRFELQGNHDNALIPVRGLREILRYGNINTLQNLFEGNQVSQSDLQKFDELKEEISKLQTKRELLHHTLMDVKKPSSLELGKYEKLLREITKYRELKNKIYLHNPKQAHQLIMAYLGRMISYAQLYERDIYFVLLSILFLTQKQPRPDKNDKQWVKLIKKGQVLSAVKMTGKNEPSADINNICQSLQQRFRVSDSQIRNDLAHINYLQGGSSKELNLIEITNQVRDIMAYDRKLKNAVSKSVCDLFARHNFLLAFKMDQHQLAFKQLDAKTIYHLGNKTISEKLHSEAFCKVIEKLFG